jgi:spore germination protein KB
MNGINHMGKISINQLFCLVMMGQIGSTNLWALGIEAKQDAWIVILLSMLVGLGLIWIFTQLNSKFPEDNIAEINISILGKVIGWPLAFLYALLYTFNATRNASEFGELINMTFLQDTPRFVIIVIFLFVIIYILFLGIETLARITEIILPVTLILIITIFILTIFSGMIKIKELTPILGNGFKPVLKAFYPLGLNFPFGLAFVFFQVWKYVDCKQEIRKTTLWAVGISGIFMTITIITIITSLGTNFAANATIPFLEVIKLINIGDIITNLDAIGVILIFIGGFYLAILNFFTSVMILTTLFKIKNYRWVLFPLAAFILWYSSVYEPNYPFHVKYLNPQYWQQMIPFHNIIPILLLIIFGLKNYSGKFNKRKT